MLASIGPQLRTIRKAKALTLKQLSERSGLSIGYLSNIERDLTSPTISTLFDLCKVLGVDMSAFLEPFSTKEHILRKRDRETVFYFEPSKAKYEAISPKDSKLKGYCITIEPEGVSGGTADREPHSHSNDEIGVILQGTLELTIGNQTYFLEEGDTFCIEANTPHSYKNSGKTDSIHYCFSTYYDFDADALKGED